MERQKRYGPGCWGLIVKFWHAGAPDAHLTSRTARALYRGGYRTLETIRKARDEELLALTQIGPASLALVRQCFPRAEESPESKSDA